MGATKYRWRKRVVRCAQIRDDGYTRGLNLKRRLCTTNMTTTYAPGAGAYMLPC